MGRKSRRNIKETVPVIQTGQEHIPTAIYARLSVENSGKEDDGAAIANQIEICKEYIEESSELQLVKVYEDNGWTGTVMRRPSFNELMEDVRKGIIKAIVVRDLSRFGRNYIETGTYLEKIFPRLNVRFISVKERFDTFKVDKSNESLMVPLQNLINDLYSKDISRKIKAAFHVQMEEGTFRWRTLPYGYQWDKEHKNIIPDEVRAPVIRDIFQWFVDGMSYGKIAKKLDELGVPTYYSKNGDERKLWKTSTIRDILSNPAYIGKHVYGCTCSMEYGGTKRKKVPEKDWYVIENAHEPLISLEIYNRVKEKRIQNTKKRHESLKRTAQVREGMIDFFENKIFCADCGYRMYFYRGKTASGKRRTANYYCSSSTTRKYLGCSYHRILQDVLNEKVMAALRMQVEVALDYEAVIRKYKDSKADRDIRNRIDKKIRGISQKIHTLQTKKTRLYEDFTEGILDETEYSYAKGTYGEEYESLNKQLEHLVMEREEYREMVSSENKWIRMMKNMNGISELSQELVDTAIDRIFVYEGGNIEIKMKYQDIFELTKSYVGEIQREEEAVDGGTKDCDIHQAVNG